MTETSRFILQIIDLEDCSTRTWNVDSDLEALAIMQDEVNREGIKATY